jgi:hypothetical protein
MTILEAIHDPLLFKPLFRDLSTWNSWLVVLRAIFALPMEEADLPLYRQLTGREVPSTTQAEEAWLICGRRSGKSRIAALIAVFLSCFKDYSQQVAPGERITVMVLACDRRQARVIFSYVLAALEAVPMLSALIERQDAESIDLSNGVTIEIVTNSFRSVRGFTIGAAILDEIAYWRSELSASPDVEVLNAIRPALATVPNALIVSLGSPYRQNGVLHSIFKRHFGQTNDPILVVQAPSQVMNPTIADSVIARAMETDPIAAQSEWFATFRNDVGSFLDLDLIDQAVEPGRRERPPLHHINGESIQYYAFADPSGGAHDSFTLAIGHAEGDRCVLDVIRGRKPPFSPADVVREFSDLLRSYRLHEVTGDRYSMEWVREAFSKSGITYRHSDLNKSELYLESLPLFTTRTVDLLDHQILRNELAQLERRTARSGKDSVDHAPGGHDDHANAACGCLVGVNSQSRWEGGMVDIIGW